MSSTMSFNILSSASFGIPVCAIWRAVQRGSQCVVQYVGCEVWRATAYRAVGPQYAVQ